MIRRNVILIACLLVLPSCGGKKYSPGFYRAEDPKAAIIPLIAITNSDKVQFYESRYTVDDNAKFDAANGLGLLFRTSNTETQTDPFPLSGQGINNRTGTPEEFVWGSVSSDGEKRLKVSMRRAAKYMETGVELQNFVLVEVSKEDFKATLLELVKPYQHRDDQFGEHAETACQDIFAAKCSDVYVKKAR